MIDVGSFALGALSLLLGEGILWVLWRVADMEEQDPILRRVARDETGEIGRPIRLEPSGHGVPVRRGQPLGWPAETKTTNRRAAWICGIAVLIVGVLGALIVAGCQSPASVLSEVEVRLPAGEKADAIVPDGAGFAVVSRVAYPGEPPSVMHLHRYSASGEPMQAVHVVEQPAPPIPPQEEQPEPNPAPDPVEGRPLLPAAGGI